MVDLLEETESIPAAYPAVDPRWMVYNGLDNGQDTDQDKDPGSDQIWQRIESYSRTRYTDRQVVWIVEGHADTNWKPPLSPVTTLTGEHWANGAWSAVNLDNGPIGYVLPADGHFRITAQVGGGDIPAAVSEAFKRLHEYSRGIAEQFKGDTAWRSSDGSETTAFWAAKALQLSGAADLLRPYRRLK